MKKVFINALVIITVSSFALHTQSFARTPTNQSGFESSPSFTTGAVQIGAAQIGAAQTPVTPDPKTTYGWVFLEAGKTATTNVSVPADALGALGAADPTTGVGLSLAGIVGLAQVNSDSPINVTLARANLAFRGGGRANNKSTGDDGKPRYNVFLELEFSLPSGTSAPSGKQIPVQLTLENALNGNKLTFYVVAQVR